MNFYRIKFTMIVIYTYLLSIKSNTFSLYLFRVILKINNWNFRLQGLSNLILNAVFLHVL
jgi:hypothetical protein